VGDRGAPRTRTENEWAAGNYLSPGTVERDVLRHQNRLRLGMAAARFPEIQNRLPLLSCVALV
jgi:hypothetical protein